METRAVFLRWGDEAENLKRHLSSASLELLGPEKEREFAMRMANGDKEARKCFIMANIRLVLSIAKKYAPKCNHLISFGDLVAEGCVGLIRAVDKFKVKKNHRFSTYATWWIRQAIERLLINHSVSAAKVTTYAHELFPKYLNCLEVLGEKLGRQPFPEEIAKYLKIKLSAVLKLQNAYIENISLCDEEYPGEDSEMLIDKISDERFRPDSQAIRKDIFRKAIFVIAGMSSIQREALFWQIDLSQDCDETADFVGSKYGLTGKSFRRELYRAQGMLQEAFSGA